MNDSAKKLFLLDGMALIYRAHFVFLRNPRRTSTGLNTSAIFGFANTLLSLLEQENPTHIAVAFDTDEPTPRHLKFPEYKAQREEMPEELSLAIPQVERLIQAFHIPVIICPGYEADDIIGTLARRAEEEGFQTYMVTPDKDFAQLVSDRTFLYRPGRAGDDAEVLGVPEVCRQWEVERPEQVIDVLGLWGDSSDNIPGVPGIGEKTAKALVAQYGSVEGVLAHTGELKGKQKENLETHAEQARLSKWLATIMRDAPVAVELEALRRREPDREQLRALFEEFEFRTLAQRVLGPPTRPQPLQATLPGFEPEKLAVSRPAAPAGLKTIADVPHDYRLVANRQQRANLLTHLRQQPSFCVDCETTGLDPKTAELVGLAFSCQDHTGFYVPFPPDQLASRELLEEFRPLLEDPAIEKVGHNLKFDLAVLQWQGVAVRGRLWDTMIAHQLVAPTLRHTMDFLAEHYLGYSPIPITALIGEAGPNQRTMRDVPAERAAEYAAEDADITWQLRRRLEPLLHEHHAMRIFEEVECPLIPALVSMEVEGVALDGAALKEYGEQLASEIVELKRTIYEQAGVTFDLDSPKQLGQVLFETLKLDPNPPRTRTGQYSTDAQVLAQLAPRHQVVRLILEYRELRKLETTYVHQLPAAIFPVTRRIHTQFSQAVTSTGRLTSQNPNLQNIPIRTERGREIRRAFVPRGEGYLLLSADYSQIELRIIAALSHDQAMLEAFRQGLDIHRATAARVYGVPIDEVTAEMRRNAKTTNFGIIYGISAFGLAQRLGISRQDANKLIDQYFEQYPGIKHYLDATIAFAREHGYVETVLGRRRYLPDINSRNQATRGAAERNAINAPIQGTAADMIKIAMANIHRALLERELRTKMILQVHDELVFDLRQEEYDEVRPLVEECMVNALPLEVPIVVEFGTGRNWLEAH